MNTRVGKLELAVPQARDASFRPTVFERWQRSEAALGAALQSMCVHGVSTRKVGQALEDLAGFDVSAATVSEASSKLDEEIVLWRHRRLEKAYPHVLLDARYEKVRRGGRIRTVATLIVAGVNEEGRREILALETGGSEAEAFWADVLWSLKARGPRGVETVASDAHAGRRRAIERHFQGAVWQRCRVHFMREAASKVRRKDQARFLGERSEVFKGYDAQRSLELAEDLARRWEAEAPWAARMMREGLADCLGVCSLAPEHRRRLHSTNMLERLMREIKRRTRVVGIFPDEASLVRLVGALLVEMDEKWSLEKARCLDLDRKEDLPKPPDPK